MTNVSFGKEEETSPMRSFSTVLEVAETYSLPKRWKPTRMTKALTQGSEGLREELGSSEVKGRV